MKSESIRILDLGNAEKEVDCQQHRPFIKNVRIVLEHLHGRWDIKVIGGVRYKVPASLSTKTAMDLLGYSQVNTNLLLKRMVRNGILTETFNSCREDGRKSHYIFSVAP